MSHIAVERNRRRQMNEHLKLLRSLTPSFYIKRGDQASIIGGVVDFIKELHKIHQVLDSKKLRKNTLSLNLSLRPSPRHFPQLAKSSSDSCPSPRHFPPLAEPSISDSSPNPRHFPQLAKPSSDSSPSPRLLGRFKELGACCNTSVADVEAKISGSNVVLRIVCRRAGGQVGKIVTALERLCFDLLQLNISSMENTVLYSIIVKIGLECVISVEELAQEVQKSLYQDEFSTISNKNDKLQLASIEVNQYGLERFVS